MKFLRLEFLITLLLTATLAPIAVNNLWPRTLTISSGEHWVVSGSTDGISGGNTYCDTYDSGESFVLDYHVVDEHATPYALIAIQPAEAGFFDLSWVESFNVRLRNQGSDDYFRIQFRNFEPISTADDFSSHKYNEVVVRPTQGFKTYEFKRSEFYVPAWWIQQYKIDGEAARPAFNCVSRIELTTLSRESSGQLEIASVSGTGHWIPVAVLYPALLGLWTLAAFGWLVGRVWKLRVALREKQAAERKLLAINDELSVQSKELVTIASQDPLTGLLNRRGIRESISNAMAQLRAGKPLSVMLLDIDKFKTINDCEGHTFGDQVLRDLVTRIGRHIHEPNVAARWGGEEFVILCPSMDAESAGELAELIRLECADSSMGYTCSIGIAEAYVAEDFAQCLERADKCLYQAKDNGRNQIKVDRGRLGRSESGIATGVSLR